MPGRRPTPLSDELFGAGPGPVLLGATNNGMPLPVKNTFVDMPSGLTPASMKHEKPSKGMKSAPADLNLRSQGFLRRALQQVVAELEAEEEVLEEHGRCADSFCTPPATPAVVASEFLSPGVTPAAGKPNQLMTVEVIPGTPGTCSAPATSAASHTGTGAAAAWGQHAGAGAAASVQASGATQQVPSVPAGQPGQPAQARVVSTPIAVPTQAPAQVPVPGQQMAPAEKLLLLEEDAMDNTLRACPGAVAHGLGFSINGCLCNFCNPDQKKHKREGKKKAKVSSSVPSLASEGPTAEACLSPHALLTGTRVDLVNSYDTHQFFTHGHAATILGQEEALCQAVAAMHSLAPPPVQSPRLASVLDMSTPPPPLQSPKLPGDP